MEEGEHRRPVACRELERSNGSWLDIFQFGRGMGLDTNLGGLMLLGG